jgi:hypothetical protein
MVRVWPPLDIGRTTTLEEEVEIARTAPHGAVLETHINKATAQWHLEQLILAGIPAHIQASPRAYHLEHDEALQRALHIKLPDEVYNVIRGSKAGSKARVGWSPYGRRRARHG